MIFCFCSMLHPSRTSAWSFAQQTSVICCHLFAWKSRSRWWLAASQRTTGPNWRPRFWRHFGRHFLTRRARITNRTCHLVCFFKVLLFQSFAFVCFECHWVHFYCTAWKGANFSTWSHLTPLTVPLPTPRGTKKAKTAALKAGENQKDDKPDDAVDEEPKKDDVEPKKKGGRPPTAAGGEDAKSKLMSKLLANTASKWWICGFLITSSVSVGPICFSTCTSTYNCIRINSSTMENKKYLSAKNSSWRECRQLTDWLVAAALG